MSKLLILLGLIVLAVVVVEGYDQATHSFDLDQGIAGMLGAITSIYWFVTHNDQPVSVIILLVGGTLTLTRIVTFVFADR